jgi:hypothetical protein
VGTVRVLAVADGDQVGGIAYFDAVAATVPRIARCAPGTARSLPSFLSRTPGAEHHYSAVRHDDPAVILTAADLGALRELIRADYLSRPVPPGGYPANGPGHPARNQAAMPAEPAAVGPPEHPLYALTTYELKDRRRA